MVEKKEEINLLYTSPKLENGHADRYAASGNGL